MKLPGLRFGLSALLIAMTLTAVPLAWRANVVSRQNDAIATLRNSGLDVGISSVDDATTQVDFFGGGDVVEVDIRGHSSDAPTSLTPDVLRSLGGFPSLERLEINGFDLAPEHIAALDGSTTLQEFVWIFDPDKGAKHHAEAIAALPELYPNLEVVDLCGMPATDNDLLPLAKLSRLRSLRTYGGRFDGSFLSRFSDLPLEELELDSDRFKPEAFADLRQFRRLSYVAVAGSKLPVGVLGAAIELNYVESLHFCIEAGPLPGDKVQALTTANSPSMYAGFWDLSRNIVPEDGWLYERRPID